MELRFPTLTDILKREMCPFSAKGSFNRNRGWEYLELSTVPTLDCLVIQ